MDVVAIKERPDAIRSWRLAIIVRSVSARRACSRSLTLALSRVKATWWRALVANALQRESQSKF
jgi:hypothetical protein